LLANNNNNNNNNNTICKAPKALASEALAADQSWVLLNLFCNQMRLSWAVAVDNAPADLLAGF